MLSQRHQGRSDSKRQHRWGCFLAVLLVALAVCVGDAHATSGSATRCPVDALPKRGQPIEVVVWHRYVGETQRELSRLAKEYNASQDRVVVRVEHPAPSDDELRARYKDATHSGSLPALAILEYIDVRSLADSGTIVPGQACFRADHISLDQFSPVARKAFSVDGVLQPVSVNLAAPMMYINREHFVRAGLNPDNPPQTLAQLRAAAEALRAAGVTQKPIVMPLNPAYLETWINGAHQTIVDQHDGRSSRRPRAATLENPATEYALTWLRSTVADGLLNPVDVRSGIDTFEHYLQMALGRASITFDTSTAIATIDAALAGTLDPKDIGIDIPLPALPLDLDIGVARFPGIEGQNSSPVAGSAWYLTNTTPVKVQAAAWDFVKFVNSRRAQAEWSLQGSIVSWRNDVAPDPTQSRRAQWLATARDSLTDAVAGPLVGPYQQVLAAITQLVDAAVVNGADLQQSITAANRRITKALEQYNEASKR